MSAGGFPHAVPPSPPPLDECYDRRTLAALDAGVEPVRAPDRPPLTGWRRGFAGGALVTGLTLGMRAVFDPEPPGESVIEVAPDPGLDLRGPVTVFFVPGDPEGTVAVVRHRRA